MVSKNENSVEMDDRARAAAVEAALAQIERNHGKGAIMSLDGEEKVEDGISTGSLSLDIALGGSGLPRGRIVEIFGPESSGKTTLTLHTIAEAQKSGGYAAFIDAEHAFDPSYARKLGVDTKGARFKVSQPSSGEEALDITETLVRSNAFDIIVIDSVAALVPKAELEGEMGDAHVGLQARLMSQALRKLTAAIARARTTVIFINQIREKIGVFFGSPETTTGGRALKFYASVRIDIRRIGQIKVGEENVGSRTKATVVKNKCAPPFRRAEFDIVFDVGIHRMADVIDLATNSRVLDKSGSWYAYKGERLGQGREKTIEMLKDKPEMLAKIEAEVKEAMRPKIPANARPASPANPTGPGASAAPAAGLAGATSTPLAGHAGSDDGDATPAGNGAAARGAPTSAAAAASALRKSPPPPAPRR
jgi:recombination protein RecA